MILNENDFSRTNVRVSMLKGRRDRLRQRVADPHLAAAAHVEIAHLDHRIEELSAELRTYRELLSGTNTTTTPDVVTLIDVPARLIQRRIRLRMTQFDLGDAAGQTRQSISRYERTLYASASLARLIQIDSLLRTEELNRRETESHPMVISL